MEGQASPQPPTMEGQASPQPPTMEGQASPQPPTNFQYRPAYVCLCARFPEGFPTKSVVFIAIISALLMLSSLYVYPTNNI
jgi:hypothetical protein